MSTGEPKIALVHDELIRRGGAEVVFEEMTKIFPSADIYALYTGRPILEFEKQKRKIHTSFLQKLPKWFRRHPSRMLPLLPLAAEKFDFSKYDVVLSSASGFAKAIITRANVPHICYCHTPTRYLWEPRKARFAHHVASPLLHYLRMMDYVAAQRVDVWLANSKYTQRRIRKYYGRESTVIYPPIQTDFFVPSPGPRRYFLVVGRRSPTKRFEQAVFVCKKLSLPLKIVGEAGDGHVSDKELRASLRQARAVLTPGVEDFGMVAAEALACGTPVIAQNAGGVREIVSRETGVLYSGDTAEALAEGIRQFLARESSFEAFVLQQSATKFSTAIFREQLLKTVAETFRVWKS